MVRDLPDPAGTRIEVIEALANVLIRPLCRTSDMSELCTERPPTVRPDQSQNQTAVISGMGPRTVCP